MIFVVNRAIIRDAADDGIPFRLITLSDESQRLHIEVDLLQATPPWLCVLKSATMVLIGPAILVLGFIV